MNLSVYLLLTALASPAPKIHSKKYPGLILTCVDVKSSNACGDPKVVEFTGRIREDPDSYEAVLLRNVEEVRIERGFFPWCRVPIFRAEKVDVTELNEAIKVPLLCIHGVTTQPQAHLERCRENREAFQNWDLIPVIWPTSTSILKYMRQGKYLEGSGEALRKMKVYAEKFPKKAILAHSMGNRVLSKAADEAFKFDLIFMAGADVDHRIFDKEYIESGPDDGLRIGRMLGNNNATSKIYVLFSQADPALWVSRIFMGASRLGLTGVDEKKLHDELRGKIASKKFHVISHHFHWTEAGIRSINDAASGPTRETKSSEKKVKKIVKSDPLNGDEGGADVDQRIFDKEYIESGPDGGLRKQRMLENNNARSKIDVLFRKANPSLWVSRIGSKIYVLLRACCYGLTGVVAEKLLDIYRAISNRLLTAKRRIYKEVLNSYLEPRAAKLTEEMAKKQMRFRRLEKEKLHDELLTTKVNEYYKTLGGESWQESKSSGKREFTTTEYYKKSGAKLWQESESSGKRDESLHDEFTRKENVFRTVEAKKRKIIPRAVPKSLEKRVKRQGAQGQGLDSKKKDVTGGIFSKWHLKGERKAGFLSREVIDFIDSKSI